FRAYACVLGDISLIDLADSLIRIPDFGRSVWKATGQLAAQAPTSSEISAPMFPVTASPQSSRTNCQDTGAGRLRKGSRRAVASAAPTRSHNGPGQLLGVGKPARSRCNDHDHWTKNTFVPALT